MKQYNKPRKSHALFEKGALINNNTVLRMLRCKTETRPGLVALYDIWPGNGAGQFLQPQSPHEANTNQSSMQKLNILIDS